MDYGRRVIIASLAITCELLSHKSRVHPHIRSVALKQPVVTSRPTIRLRCEATRRLRQKIDLLIFLIPHSKVVANSYRSRVVLATTGLLVGCRAVHM